MSIGRSPFEHNRRLLALTPDFIGPMMTLQYAGSIAHGTYVPSIDPNHIDDVDIMGIWLPTSKQVFGLEVAEHWMTWDDELDIVTYEVRKFARLLLKANPNVLGMLWASHASLYQNVPLWSQWIENRNLFLSQRVYDSFSGYAYSQLMKLQKPNTKGYMGEERKALFAKYGYDIKNAAHCLRLLRMGVELFETGELNVDRTNIDAEELKEIKSGKWSFKQIEKAANEGFDRMHVFKGKKVFPEKPDYKTIEDMVMETVECGIAIASTENTYA